MASGRNIRARDSAPRDASSTCAFDGDNKVRTAYSTYHHPKKHLPYNGCGIEQNVFAGIGAQFAFTPQSSQQNQARAQTSVKPKQVIMLVDTRLEAGEGRGCGDSMQNWLGCREDKVVANLGGVPGPKSRKTLDAL
jgi:hypothetical protein